jgi:mannose-6-phosphate isomerase-like protein (cupin superfamily)
VTQVISRENAEHYDWGDGCEGWRLAEEPKLSVILERVPPGGAEMKHYHDRARQCFFVLSGRATMEIGDQCLQLQAQQACTILPGIPHSIANPTEEDLVFLVISAPTSQGDRVLMEPR